MFVRAYLRASTDDQDANRARDQLKTANWPAESYAASSLDDALKRGATLVTDDAQSLLHETLLGRFDSTHHLQLPGTLALKIPGPGCGNFRFFEGRQFLVIARQFLFVH